MSIKDYEWPVTGYSFCLAAKGFGWIQLKDGEQIAGYIYLTDEDKPNFFGNLGSTHPYMVMHQPTSHLQAILDILRNERPLQISGYQVDDSEIRVLLSTSSVEPVGEGAEGDPGLIHWRYRP